jgi:hypothetical protein
VTRVPADAENAQRWRARVKSVTGRRGHRCLDLTLWADNERAEEVMREAVRDWRPNRPDGDLYSCVVEEFGVVTFRGRFEFGGAANVVTFTHLGREKVIVQDVTAWPRTRRGTKGKR